MRALENYSPLGHIITLGLDRHVTGFTGGIETVRQMRREVDNVGGVMILAHPFRYLFDLPGIYSQNILFEDPLDMPASPEEAAQHPVFELVDDVEVVNGANNEKENRFAQGVAQVLGKPGTGGSDAHSVNGLGKGSTVLPSEFEMRETYWTPSGRENMLLRKGSTWANPGNSFPRTTAAFRD